MFAARPPCPGKTQANAEEGYTRYRTKAWQLCCGIAVHHLVVSNRKVGFLFLDSTRGPYACCRTQPGPETIGGHDMPPLHVYSVVRADNSNRFQPMPCC